MFWCLPFHLGAFETVRYCTKLAAKHAKLVQLMQKFVPRSRVRMFHNVCFRSTPLDPKLMFWCVLSVWVHLGLFRYCTKMRQTGAINAKVRATKSCRNFLQRRSQSTPSDPKLMFWCVSFRLGAFGTVSLLHETRCKMGQPVAINAKVRATKSRKNFTNLTLPIHIIGP